MAKRNACYPTTSWPVQNTQKHAKVPSAHRSRIGLKLSCSPTVSTAALYSCTLSVPVEACKLSQLFSRRVATKENDLPSMLPDGARRHVARRVCAPSQLWQSEKHAIPQSLGLCKTHKKHSQIHIGVHHLRGLSGRQRLHDLKHRRPATAQSAKRTSFSHRS